MNLRSDQTFAEFVPVPSNAVAHWTCVAVARGGGGSSRPVILFGPTGTGKSHLLQAVGQLFLQVEPSRTVVYLSACDLVDEYCSALVAGTVDAFLDAEFGPSLLLVDDLHFLVDRPSSFGALKRRMSRLVTKGTVVVAAGTCSDAETVPRWVFAGTDGIQIAYPADSELRHIAGVLAARRETPVTSRGLSAVARASNRDIRRLVGGLIEFEAAASPGFLRP